MGRTIRHPSQCHNPGDWQAKPLQDLGQRFGIIEHLGLDHKTRPGCLLQDCPPAPKDCGGDLCQVVEATKGNIAGSPGRRLGGWFGGVHGRIITEEAARHADKLLTVKPLGHAGGIGNSIGYPVIDLWQAG